MSWYYQDAAVSLLLGDASEQLRALPAKSVACVVSSPPYYSLRDYGHDGQIGLEDTPDEVVARPAVKGKYVGAIVKESDSENMPLFACGHKHDYAPEAIACIRRSITRLYPNFNVVN